MSNSSVFCPDWKSSPGETIIELMEQHELSTEDLADQIGLSVASVVCLLNGELAIDQQIAIGLEASLGPSKAFWLKRQSDFYPVEEIIEPTDEAGWLKRLPVTDMIKFGWIEGNKKAFERIEACREFFDLEALTQLEDLLCRPEYGAAYRTSQAIKSNPCSTLCWLRQGEILANQFEVSSWNASKLNECIPTLRRLTWQKRPGMFLPEIRTLLADAGVHFILLQAPKGCAASGATWVTSSDKIIIQMSCRYLSDDHFWFTLFHEIGHLLFHKSYLPIFEMSRNETDALEAEANLFAAQTIIPFENVEELQTLQKSKTEIIRFARKIGVAPGLVVGQMQHNCLIGFNQMNHLKRRFKWTDNVQYFSHI